MTISSQKTPLAAWSLFSPHRQDFLKKKLARVPVTPNPQGTHEKRDDVLSSVSAQDMDTSWYQLFDLQDDEFYWENDQLDVDAVLRPGIDTPLSPTTLDDLKKGGSAEKAIQFDEGEYKDSNNTSLWETNATPCIAEKSSIWIRKRQCSLLCVKKFVSISITVYVF